MAYYVQAHEPQFAEGQRREEKWRISEPFFKKSSSILFLITWKHITSGDIFFFDLCCGQIILRPLTNYSY